MGEMLPLETKHLSGGKLLPHSDLLGGVPLEEVSCHRAFVFPFVIQKLKD